MAKLLPQDRALNRREPHTPDHAPVGILFACMKPGCCKVTLQFFNGGASQSLSAWMSLEEVKSMLSMLKDEIQRQSYDLLK